MSARAGSIGEEFRQLLQRLTIQAGFELALPATVLTGDNPATEGQPVQPTTDCDDDT